MQIRDAIEDDAEGMAAISDAPADVMRNLVHDRTVRVAEPDDAEPPNEAASAGNVTVELDGFVSFDVREDTVHVTQLDGTTDACVQLLEEPIRFARGEAMSVQLLVPEPDEAIADAADEVGFDRVGRGPRFQGKPTVKYRLEP
jgi:hypothetical protein